MIVSVYRVPPQAAPALRAGLMPAPMMAGTTTETSTPPPSRRIVLRFVDKLVVFDDADTGAFPAATPPEERLVREHTASHPELPLESLFLVTQEGRLFQQHYPDVPVLFDRGRHLLVSLTAARAAHLHEEHEHGVSIEPVTEDADLVTPCPCPEPRPTPDPAILTIVDRLSPTAVKADVTALVTLLTRQSVTTHFRRASMWAADRFASFGLDVTTWEFNIAPSRRTPTGRSCSVIADNPGVAPGPRGLVIVCAHLDSTAGKVPLEKIAVTAAPGADDNASGSAGVIEMARVLAREHMRHDVRFILFGGEEQGLLGSARYVAALSQAERDRIIGAVNMDMIAVDNPAGSPPAVLLEGKPISKPMIEALCHAAHAYTALSVTASLDAKDSDHVSFLDAGIPSVLTIEGNDGGNERIHTPRDTLDYLKYDLAHRILRMNTAYVAAAAGLLSVASG